VAQLDEHFAFRCSAARAARARGADPSRLERNAPIASRPTIGHVTAYRLDADKTTVTGATATQHGTYHQDVTGPDGKPIHVDGVFDASWQRDADGRWRIARMHTNSQ